MTNERYQLVKSFEQCSSLTHPLTTTVVNLTPKLSRKTDLTSGNLNNKELFEFYLHCQLESCRFPLGKPISTKQHI